MGICVVECDMALKVTKSLEIFLQVLRYLRVSILLIECAKGYGICTNDCTIIRQYMKTAVGKVIEYDTFSAAVQLYYKFYNLIVF
jgi:hypothetical protein